MLTKEERLRALKCNLKNYNWTVTPQFRLEREDAEALLELLIRDLGSEPTDEAPRNRRFTLMAKSADELKRVLEYVDSYMSQRIGENIISYQVIGESQTQPYDYGFITDRALEELKQEFIIIPGSIGTGLIYNSLNQ